MRERVEKVHEDLTFAVKVLASQPEQVGYRKAVAEYRNIDVEIFERHNCFFISTPDDLRGVIGDEYYTNLDLGFMSKKGYSMYRERFIFPCYNARGEVAGMVGYDNEHHYKYLLSTTLGFEKTNVTFGHQDLPQIYEEDYVVLVEGIMEYMRLKLLGYPVFALQGLMVGPYVEKILRRLSNIVLLLDSDPAGTKAADRIYKMFPNVTKVFMERTYVNKIDADIYLSYKENQVEFAKEIRKVKDRWKSYRYDTVLLENKSPELYERMRNYENRRVEEDEARGADDAV